MNGEGFKTAMFVIKLLKSVPKMNSMPSTLFRLFVLFLLAKGRNPMKINQYDFQLRPISILFNENSEAFKGQSIGGRLSFFDHINHEKSIKNP